MDPMSGKQTHPTCRNVSATFPTSKENEDEDNACVAEWPIGLGDMLLDLVSIRFASERAKSSWPRAELWSLLPILRNEDEHDVMLH